jgi:mono/diheme cytochrome c family protein
MKTNIISFLIGLVLLPAIVFVTMLLGLWPSEATSNPSRVERTLARSSLQSYLARKSGGVLNPVKPTEETLLAGMKIYRMNCAGCHGDAGQPSLWGTKGFYPRVPQFADAPSQLKPPEMFFVVKNGIRYSGMGAWNGMLSEDDVWKVVTFLSNLRSLTPSVDEAWRKKELR